MDPSCKDQLGDRAQTILCAFNVFMFVLVLLVCHWYESVFLSGQGFPEVFVVSVLKFAFAPPAAAGRKHVFKRFRKSCQNRPDTLTRQASTTAACWRAEELILSESRMQASVFEACCFVYGVCDLHVCMHISHLHRHRARVTHFTVTLWTIVQPSGCDEIRIKLQLHSAHVQKVWHRVSDEASEPRVSTGARTPATHRVCSRDSGQYVYECAQTEWKHQQREAKGSIFRGHTERIDLHPHSCRACRTTQRLSASSEDVPWAATRGEFHDMQGILQYCLDVIREGPEVLQGCLDVAEPGKKTPQRKAAHVPCSPENETLTKTQTSKKTTLKRPAWSIGDGDTQSNLKNIITAMMGERKGQSSFIPARSASKVETVGPGSHSQFSTMDAIAHDTLQLSFSTWNTRSRSRVRQCLYGLENPVTAMGLRGCAAIGRRNIPFGLALLHCGFGQRRKSWHVLLEG